MKYQVKFIQIIRGLAALAVLIFHLEISTQKYFEHNFFNFEYGYLGVDLFFALSGFIITYIHLKDIKEGGSVQNFIKKRFIRIFPLYWIVLIVAIALQYPEFEHKPNLIGDLDPHTLSGWVTIIKNILLFPLEGSQMPVGVAWTLMYEISFYFIFAIAISSGWKIAKIILGVWVLLILIYSRDIIPRSIILDTFTGTLIVEFLFGCLAGYIFIYSKRTLTLPVVLILLSFIALLFAAYLAWHPFNRYSIAITTLMGAAGALIVLYAATLDRNNKYSWLGIPALVLIGDASYSIYITHPLYISYLCKLFAYIFNVSDFSDWMKNILIVVIAVICIMIGILIHIWMEKPLLSYCRSKFKFENRKKPIPALQ